MTVSLGKLSLSTVLLFVLGAYSLIIVPGTGPSVLVLFFILVGILGWLDIRGSSTFHKSIMLVIALLFVVATLLSITISSRFSGEMYVHDNVLQIEAALDYLKQGQNPYVENYVGTIMDNMDTIRTVNGYEMENPALYHNLKLPFHMLFSLPFSYSDGFDQRYVYALTFVIVLGVLISWPKKYEHKALLATLVTFNPLFLQFFITGRDDVFVLAWLLLSLFLLDKKKYIPSAIVLGFALASKHSAVIILPFYVAYLYFLVDNTHSIWEKCLEVFKKIYPAIITALVLFVPFIVWNAPAFWQDSVQYPLGMLETGYPINGYNIQSVLVELGYISSPVEYFSNLPLLVILALPLLWFLIRQQKKNNSVSTLILAYGVFLLVFWLLSRFFHDNHIGYVAQILLVGVFLSKSTSSLSS